MIISRSLPDRGEVGAGLVDLAQGEGVLVWHTMRMPRIWLVAEFLGRAESGDGCCLSCSGLGAIVTARFGSIPTVTCSTAPILDGTARPSKALTCPRYRPKRRGPSRTTEKLALRKRISGENLAHVTEGASGLPRRRSCHQAALRTVAWRRLRIGISAKI
jgi:hypothetical protein